MDQKIKKSFLYNLVIVFLLCAGLYFIFFSSLGYLTHHGEEVKVPDVTNKNFKVAQSLLEKEGFDVEIDSSFDPKKKPYVVLSQLPNVGATVKDGRTVFLTINKKDPPLTSMPKLTDLSYRSAVLIINSSRLVLGDTTHKPDYANGAVLDQLYKGVSIKAGDMLPQGSKIDLVVGDGFGNVDMNVPDVIGMSVEEGLAILSGNGLTYTTVWDGTIDDSSTAIIYYQRPSPYNELNAPNRIKEGDVVDIRIKQNPENDEMENNRRPSSTVNNDVPKDNTQ